MEIAPRIRRLGISMINSYLIEDAGAATIVEAGVPGGGGGQASPLLKGGGPIHVTIT